MSLPSQIYDQAVARHRAGDLVGAALLCGRILADEPASFHGNYLLGIIRFQQGRPEEALAAVDAALKAQPGAVDALVIQGLAQQALLRLGEALDSFDRALAIQPEFEKAVWCRAVLLDRMGRAAQALSAYGHLLHQRPQHGGALKAKASLLLRLGRLAEALEAHDAALAADPSEAQLHNGRGIALAGLGRYQEAIDSFSFAIAQNATAAFVNNRGKAFLSIERSQEALADFEHAVALDPQSAEAWTNRGTALWHLQRLREAIESHDAAIAREPGLANAFHNRANARRSLHQFAEAERDYRQALTLQPDHSQANYNLGALLCEQGRLDDGFAIFRQWANRLSERGDFEQAPPARRQHDQQQQHYRQAHGLTPVEPDKLHMEAGERLPGPALNTARTDAAAARWQAAEPKILVIDDFLTPRALDALQRHCWGSTIWRKAYDNYLGAFPEHGFCSPLLAQIAEELPRSLPSVFRDHPLLYLWAFKYGAGDHGTRVHADFAAVNVNFWITPDSANQDPESGGLKVWPVIAPDEWNFSRYNGDPGAIRAFLSQSGVEPVVVPYRANRAVIFDSDLFHETDRIRFNDSYTDRRINITLLYGRRHASN